MKKVLFGLALLVQTAHGVQAKFDVAGPTIPTAYSISDAKSLVMSSLYNVKAICVYNANDTERVSYSYIGKATTAPGTTQEIIVPALGWQCTSDPEKLAGVTAVFIRGTDGNITATDKVWGYAR